MSPMLTLAPPVNIRRGLERKAQAVTGVQCQGLSRQGTEVTDLRNEPLKLKFKFDFVKVIHI